MINMINKGNIGKKKVDSATRVTLIRKGNEFFTDGNFPAAERIFVATDYKDGLVRLGDHYLDKGDVYNAAKMYFMSENPSKIEAFSRRAAQVIQKWLAGDKGDITEKTYDKVLKYIK